MLSRRVLFAAIGAIVVSLVALMISIGAYSVATNPQAALTMAATRRSIGENFRWNLGEVVDVQGNLYAYLGWGYGEGNALRIGKWQNGWMELAYIGLATWGSVNVTLSPYILQVGSISNWRNYVSVTFFES